MPNELSIEQLRYDSVDVESVNFNFGAGFSETWEDVIPLLLECDYCQATFDCCGPSEWVEGDDCPDCDEATDGHLQRPECSPLMNYYYSLPDYDGDPEADQALLWLSSANVVLVKILGGEDAEDTYALALSGGGMDFSWDICLAYILLGYAPPFRFCDLPEFAGQDNSKEPFWSVLKACLQSIEAKEKRAIWQKGQLIRLVNTALECPECGHPDPHNRVGGCERSLDVGPHTVRCTCTTYPEGRPADAEAVRHG
jgi:hypothetical protein